MQGEKPCAMDNTNSNLLNTEVLINELSGFSTELRDLQPLDSVVGTLRGAA
jgi:hypothetical protein